MSEEDSRASSYLDPLFIAPESKNSEFDYQWFDVERLQPWRSLSDKGWVRVSRDAMPNEPSDEEDGVTRNELALYCRIKALSEEAVFRQIAEALAPVKVMERVRRGEASVPHGPATHPARSTSDARLREIWVPRRNGIEKTKGGYCVLVLHQETIHLRLQPWIAAAAAHLLRFRIVYLSRDESEMANRCNMTYGEWAWHKRALIREGLIGKPT